MKPALTEAALQALSEAQRDAYCEERSRALLDVLEGEAFGVSLILLLGTLSRLICTSANSEIRAVETARILMRQYPTDIGKAWRLYHARPTNKA